MDHDILSEFCIPANEIDAEIEVGDLGKLILSVEVIGKVNGVYMFRKHKKAKLEGDFKPEGAKDMRERILDKQEDDSEDDSGY